jgi:PAS domain S-box-containing protein
MNFNVDTSVLSEYNKAKIGSFQLALTKFSYIVVIGLLVVFNMLNFYSDEISVLLLNTLGIGSLMFCYFLSRKRRFLWSKILSNATYLILLVYYNHLFSKDIGLYFLYISAIVVTLFLWKKKHHYFDMSILVLYGIFGVLTVSEVWIFSEPKRLLPNDKMYFILSAVTSTLVIFLVIVKALRLYYLLFSIQKSQSVLLSNTFRHFPGLVYLIDHTYAIIYNNENYQTELKNIFGKIPKSGDSLLDYIAPMEVQSVKSAISKSLKVGEIREEKLIKFHNYGSIWVECFYNPIWDENDQFLGTLITLIDVTKIKNVQNRFAEASQFLDNSKDIFIKLDTEGRIEYSNQEAGLQLSKFNSNNKVPIEWNLPSIENIEFNSTELIVEIGERFYKFEINRNIDNGSVYIYGYEETEAIKATRLLNEQKIFFENIMSKLPSAVVVFDRLHRFVYLNEIAEPDAKLREYIIGQSESEYCKIKNKGESLIEKRQYYFNEVILTGKPIEWTEVSIENEVEKHVIKILRPVLDSSSEISHVIGHGYDVTDRIFLEKILKGQKDLTDLILDSIPIQVVLYNEKNEIVFKNFQTKQFINNYESKQNENLIHPGILFEKISSQLFQPHLEKTESTTLNIDFEKEIQFYDKLIFVNAGITSIRTHQHLYYLAFWQDISEQKEAEFKLKEQSNFIRKVIDADPNLIFVKNKSGVFTLANKATAILFGLDNPEEIMGRRVLDFHAVGKELEHFDVIDQEVIDKKVTIKLEEPFTLKDGSVRWFDTTKLPIERNFGEIHVLGISVDITERKRSEADLLEAKIDAENSSKAKSYFLSKMSHELRTPLNVITGYSELLKSDFEDKTVREYANLIVGSSSYLLEIINELLDFSRIETGKIILNEEPIELQILINELRNNLYFKSDEKKLKLTIDSNLDSDIKIITDRIRLMQILINLGYNAIKYTEKGEIKISVSIPEPINSNKILVRFVFTDTGIGIPEGKFEEIFYQYSQLNLKESSTHDGIGIGLAITKELVHLMGGKIQVNSKVGVGSRFVIDIPFKLDMDIQDKNSISISVDEEIAKLNDLTILIVEDNILNMTILNKIISKTGAKVIEAEDGVQAVEIFKNTKIDLILMDLNMPKMDGFECIRILRESNGSYQTGSDAPCIAVTADVYPETIQKTIYYGFDGYISKPISKSDLWRSIKSVLASKTSA